jgi:Right handed beta helix region
MRRYVSAVVIVCLLMAAIPLPVDAAVATVDCGGGTSLQAAIDAATPGDALVIKGRCTGTFHVLKDLTLRAANPKALLDAGGADYALTVDFDTWPAQSRGHNVIVVGLTVTGGEQAGIFNWGNLLLQDAVVRDNGGHGISADGAARTTLERTRVSGNGGWGVYAYVSNTLVRSSSIIEGNAGGGIVAYDGGADVTDSLVMSNAGTGIYCGAQSSLTMQRSTVTRNAGTGVSIGYCYASISASAITLNSKTGDGGGIAVLGWFPSAYGPVVSITDSTVSGNSATGNGGGIYYPEPYSYAEWVTISGTTIVGNSTGGDGGGIYNAGDLRITSSTVRNNRAGGTGGGIFNTALLTLDGVTVKNNRPNNCTGC